MPGRLVRCGVIAVACLLLAAPALAGGPDRVLDAAGTQQEISCLNARLCMLAGNVRRRGAITRVGGGRRVHTYLEPGQGLLSISCPTFAGCLAIGPTLTGHGEELFTVDRHGVPSAAPQPLALPPDTAIGYIACLRLTACQFSGVDHVRGRWRVELGWWNGHSLALHHVLLPAHVSDTQLAHVACSHGTCETVGYETNPAVTVQEHSQGFIVTTRHGVVVHTAYAPGFLLQGNACLSASLCYAVGFSDNEAGGIFPVVNGRPSGPLPVAGGIYGIGCARGRCTFGGAQLMGVPATQGRLGTIRHGTVVSNVEVGSVSTLFSDVTMVGSTFAAIGLPPTGNGTVIVTGPVGTTP